MNSYNIAILKFNISKQTKVLDNLMDRLEAESDPTIRQICKLAIKKETTKLNNLNIKHQQVKHLDNNKVERIV